MIKPVVKTKEELSLFYKLLESCLSKEELKHLKAEWRKAKKSVEWETFLAQNTSISILLKDIPVEVTSQMVKDLRLSTGLAQPAFADKVGISVAALRHWEIGQRNCPYYKYKDIKAKVDSGVCAM